MKITCEKYFLKQFNIFSELKWITKIYPVSRIRYCLIIKKLWKIIGSYLFIELWKGKWRLLFLRAKLYNSCFSSSPFWWKKGFSVNSMCLYWDFGVDSLFRLENKLPLLNLFLKSIISLFFNFNTINTKLVYSWTDWYIKN